MELILELFCVRRISHIEWKPIVCAILLALSLGGMYRYLSAHTEYRAETAKGDAAAAMPKVVVDMKIDMKSYIQDFLETEVEKSVPEVAPVVSETKEDTGNIPNVIAVNEPETLKPVKKKTKKKTKKKAARAEANVATEPIAPSVSTDEDKNSVLPSVSMPVDEGVGEKIEEIIKIPEPVVTREISGFICNDKGHITGYTDPSKFMKNSLVVLPRDSACTGIKKGAFKGLEDKISEIYIPANITYIEAETFDALYNLIFIEVHPRNPEFYSASGILYDKDGKVVAHPSRAM